MEKAIWTCTCGSVEAELPTRGNRLYCYCASCQDFVRKLGKDDRLNPAGGSELFQVAPSGVTLRKGKEHLRWMRLTEKGPLRWYTACCNTPMVNTLDNPRLAFASFQVADIAPKEALPKVRAHVNLKGATAHVSEPKGSAFALVFSLLASMAGARITGRWRNNPFFDATARPIAERQELT